MSETTGSQLPNHDTRQSLSGENLLPLQQQMLQYLQTKLDRESLRVHDLQSHVTPEDQMHVVARIRRGVGIRTSDEMELQRSQKRYNRLEQAREGVIAGNNTAIEPFAIEDLVYLALQLETPDPAFTSSQVRDLRGDYPFPNLPVEGIHTR